MADISERPDLDDLELEALRRAVAEADAAAQAGRVVSHDRVRPWLLGLAQGKRPRARSLSEGHLDKAGAC